MICNCVTIDYASVHLSFELGIDLVNRNLINYLSPARNDDHGRCDNVVCIEIAGDIEVLVLVLRVGVVDEPASLVHRLKALSKGETVVAVPSPKRWDLT